jgi:Domain of unknown function (DUF4189)
VKSTLFALMYAPTLFAVTPESCPQDMRPINFVCAPNIDFASIARTRSAEVSRAMSEKDARPAMAFGAIAIDGQRRYFGFGAMQSNADKAVAHAMAQCGQNDCAVVAQFADSCAALATSVDAQFAIGLDNDPKRAARKALTACDAISAAPCNLPVIPNCSGSKHQSYYFDPQFSSRNSPNWLQDQVDRQDYWGALATKNGQLFVAMISTQREAAEQSAMQQCADAHCALVTSFKNSCVAVAVADQQIIGFVNSRSPDTAKSKAQKKCNSGAASCHSEPAQCAGRDYVYDNAKQAERRE